MLIPTFSTTTIHVQRQSIHKTTIRRRLHLGPICKRRVKAYRKYHGIVMNMCAGLRKTKKQSQRRELEFQEENQQRKWEFQQQIQQRELYLLRMQGKTRELEELLKVGQVKSVILLRVNVKSL